MTARAPAPLPGDLECNWACRFICRRPRLVRIARQLAARYNGLEPERRLVRRLVPRRQEAPRVGALELREEGAAGAGGGVVVDGEEPGRLGADGTAVGDRQPVLAGRHRRREVEGGGLQGGVDPHRGHAGRRVAAGGRETDGVEAQVEGVEGDAGRRLQHLDVDRHLAAEGLRRGVGNDRHLVVRRPHRARQLGGDRGGGGRRRGGAEQRGEQRRRNGRAGGGAASRESPGGAETLANHRERSIVTPCRSRSHSAVPISSASTSMRFQRTDSTCDIAPWPTTLWPRRRPGAGGRPPTRGLAACRPSSAAPPRGRRRYPRDAR